MPNVTLKGNPVTLSGKELKAGDKAPALHAAKQCSGRRHAGRFGRQNADHRHRAVARHADLPC